jgi:hypothetical protein
MMERSPVGLLAAQLTTLCCFLRSLRSAVGSVSLRLRTSPEHAARVRFDLDSQAFTILARHGAVLAAQRDAHSYSTARQASELVSDSDRIYVVPRSAPGDKYRMPRTAFDDGPRSGQLLGTNGCSSLHTSPRSGCITPDCDAEPASEASRPGRSRGSAGHSRRKWAPARSEDTRTREKPGTVRHVSDGEPLMTASLLRV